MKTLVKLAAKSSPWIIGFDSFLICPNTRTREELLQTVNVCSYHREV